MPKTYNLSLNQERPIEDRLEDFIAGLIEAAMERTGWTVTDICPDGIYLDKDNVSIRINPVTVDRL